MPLFYAVTLFVSAGLLFLVQPMFAKMVLPLLGGTPAVWNTCMVFYQAALLAGYVYAHLGARWLGARRQAAVHLVLMIAPWLVLPVGVSAAWSPPAEIHPAPWLLLLLSASVGLPFFVVSASAPMLQSWFANTEHRAAKDPYFLYAASNLGSMLALLAYPLLVEPRLTLAQQGQWWAAGYGLLAALTFGCAMWLWRSPRPLASRAETATEGPADPSPPWGRRLRWLALSFVPSSLLLGVTAHISTDLAAVPLMWIVPLALYLLSFVLVFLRWQLPAAGRLRQVLTWATVAAAVCAAAAFGASERHRWLDLSLRVSLALAAAGAATLYLAWDPPTRHRWMVRVQPLFLLPLAMVFFQSMTDWFWTLIALHLAAFFVTAMVCHGELAGSRPHASRLTEFYLWMSLGGVLGGMFSALVAPTLFPWLGDALWGLLGWWADGARVRLSNAPLSPNVFYAILEYPLVIAAACMLRPQSTAGPQSEWTRWLVFGIPTLLVLGCGGMMAWLWHHRLPLSHSWHWSIWGHALALSGQGIILAVMALIAVVFLARAVWFGLGVAMVLIFSYLFADPDANVIYMQRSFFGVMRVSHKQRSNFHLLAHGSTTHGVQLWDPDPVRRNRPQSYYYPTGPLGHIFSRTANAERRTRVGVIGLGTGSTAGYGFSNPKLHITYFEIDPAMVRIAEDPTLFTYLTDARQQGCQIDVVLGDARLRLAEVPDGTFDLLVVDAFSSDSIPIHLLTLQAMELYLSKLAADGVLAVHVSNRYLDLEPLVGRLVDELGAVCLACSQGDSEISQEEHAAGKYASDWVAVARQAPHLGKLLDDPDWQAITVPEQTPCWTDDFSNLVAVLRRR